MKTLLSVAILSAGVALSASSAQAFTWTGCYVGVHGGAILGDDALETAIGGTLIQPGNIFSEPGNAPLFDSSRSPNDVDGTIGGQVGCNLQLNSFLVVGLEGDMNWSGLEESDSSAFGPAGPVNFGGGNFASSRTEDVTKSIEWFSTARLRAGVTGGRFLLFGTAGVAFAEIESDTRVQFGNDATFLNDSEFVGSGTETQIGIAVGGGLEYAMGRWSVEGEYLFVDFGDFDYDSPCVNASALCTGVPGASWNTTVKAQENIGRIGLSYRWGGDE